MRNITEITEAIAKKWIDIGLSTEPADRERAERGVRGCYRAARLSEPERIIWSPSPIVTAAAGRLASMILAPQNHLSVADGIKEAETVRAAIRSEAACEDIAEIVSQAVKPLSAARPDSRRPIRPVRNEIRMIGSDIKVNSFLPVEVARMGDAVERAVDTLVSDVIDRSVNRQLQGAANLCSHHITKCGLSIDWGLIFGGNLWASDRAYLEAMRSLGCDLRGKSAEEYWCDVSESAGWWWPHSNFCIITDRPSVIRRNDRGQPHNEHGPAITWRDGWSIYAWRGVSVPADVIVAPEKLTVDRIRTEPDTEIRRVMRERYGEGRYLADTKAVVIDVDHERARKGAAPRCLLRDHEDRQFLVGCDGSTDRVYYMEVETNIKTCAQAHESLCGFDESLILNKS